LYKDKSIAVVVPAYNEETQITEVITGMPTFVDWIVVVDDQSQDKTVAIVEALQSQNERLILVRHEKNQGVGGAIASGYVWARDHDADVAVVMAGDGQMDPDELSLILDPVVEGEVDYTKGNRLQHQDAFSTVPKAKYFGNAILSLLTKIASGYWHVADSQSGYTAINKMALRLINWDKMYKRYGQPNDLLVTLNVFNMRVRDIPVRPIYGIGERSGLHPHRVVLPISWLLLRKFLWRMKEKYILRDFHPLVFFYVFGFVMLLLGTFLFVRLIVLWAELGFAPELTAMALMFSVSMGLQSLFFAMWFDMEANKELR